MSLELFTFSGTPFGWSVQLAAAIKRLSLEIHWLQPTPANLKSDQFLALNPRGRVPVLRSNGFVLYESSAIISYLDALSPEPPLYGGSPEEDALIRQVVSEIDCYLSGQLPAFAGVILTGRAKESWDGVATAGDACLSEIERYEARLTDSPFVAVGQLSAADLMLYPLVAVFLRAAAKPEVAPLGIVPLFDGRFPMIRQWMARIGALPEGRSTIPPGWT